LFAIDEAKIQWPDELPPKAGCQLALHLGDLRILVGWNYLADMKYEPVAFEKMEPLVRKHLKSLDDTMVVGDCELHFRDDGAVSYGCTTIPFKTVEDIYQRAKARREGEAK